MNHEGASGSAAAPAPGLSLHTYAWEEAMVVQCTGRLTLDNSGLLKAEVRGLLPKKQKVIVDLTALSYMDSSGLGTIVGLYVSAKNAGCELQLVNLNTRIRELLGMSNVLSIFESCGRAGTRPL